MKNFTLLFLISFLLLSSKQTFSQRLLRVVNKTLCNFEACQFKYSVNDLTEGNTSIQWFPDAIRGNPIFQNGALVLPSNSALLTRWNLPSSHTYEIIIQEVILWNLYGTSQLNILPPVGGVIVMPIETQCCPSGIMEASRFYPNPPSEDFEIILSCSGGTQQ